MPTALHLLIDGMTATPPTVHQVGAFIGAVVGRMGLHIVSGPFFYDLGSHQEAFTVVAESHIAVQWWPEGLVLVDLFSCSSFDADAIVAFVVEQLGLEFYDHRVVERMGVG